jgi:hypothetical protein
MNVPLVFYSPSTSLQILHLRNPFSLGGNHHHRRQQQFGTGGQEKSSARQPVTGKSKQKLSNGGHNESS